MMSPSQTSAPAAIDGQAPLQMEQVSCNSCGGATHRAIAQGPDFEYRTSPDEFTMVQCSNCGLTYLNPRPAISELTRIYPPEYFPYRFDAVLNPLMKLARDTVQKTKVRAIQKYLPNSDSTIMDVGCGGGSFLRLLRDFGPKSWRLMGNDFSEHAMTALRQQGFEAIQGRFEELPLEPGRLDMIVLNQVIEHLDNPRAVVEKAFDVLKPGGCLFIETPSTTGWDAKLFSERHWGGYHFPRHWILYTPESLSKLLINAGFTVVETTAMCSPNFWVLSFQHACRESTLLHPLAWIFDFRNPVMMAMFTVTDLIQKQFNMTSNMRMVAQKPIR